MARKKDHSATLALVSVILALASAVATLGAAVLVGRNYSAADHFVYYNPNTMWFPALGGALLVGLGGGAVGFLLGFMSASRKNNPKARLAWLGFFMSAGMVTVATCVGLFFYFTRNAIGG